MRFLTAILLSGLPIYGQDSAQVMTNILPARALSSQDFEWRSALGQSMRLLLIQHAFRTAAQAKTRREFGGPFVADWFDSVAATRGWGDQDGKFINYVAHPIQGGATGFVQIQNDPRGRRLEFANTREYWNSRTRALAWSTAYSVQFEIGPLSESSIGNVGKRKGTSGYVDHVMTPAGGFALLIAEDAVDRYWIRPLESRTSSAALRRLYRTALNPCRSLANLLRGEAPWRRDVRGL